MRVANSFICTSSCAEEFESIIDGLSANKPPGIDGISVLTLKSIASIMVLPVSYFYVILALKKECLPMI